MDGEVRPVDRDGDGALVEMSALREEIEELERRMSGTVRGGIGITALFVVSGVFMEQSGTLWFLGVLWLLFTLRLVLINRTSERELRIKEAGLESLASPPHNTALPHGP